MSYWTDYLANVSSLYKILKNTSSEYVINLNIESVILEVILILNFLVQFIFPNLLLS